MPSLVMFLISSLLRNIPSNVWLQECFRLVTCQRPQLCSSEGTSVHRRKFPMKWLSAGWSVDPTKSVLQRVFPWFFSGFGGVSCATGNGPMVKLGKVCTWACQRIKPIITILCRVWGLKRTEDVPAKVILFGVSTCDLWGLFQWQKKQIIYVGCTPGPIWITLSTTFHGIS